MKDPKDTKTVDALASEIPKKRGRKPRGDQALTAAEKQKAYRDRKRARQTAIRAGEPVTSAVIDLETVLADALKQR